MSKNTILCKCLICLKQNKNCILISMRTYNRHRKNQQEILYQQEDLYHKRINKKLYINRMKIIIILIRMILKVLILMKKILNIILIIIIIIIVIMIVMMIMIMMRIIMILCKLIMKLIFLIKKLLKN